MADTPDWAAMLKKAEGQTEEMDWAALIKKSEEKPKRQSRASSTKKLTDFTKIARHVETWFRLEHIVHPDLNCTVKRHDEQQASRNRVVVKIGEQYVCRYCFINGRDIE